MFLCRAVLKLKLLRKIAYNFILSLTVSDLCIGIFEHGAVKIALMCRLLERNISSTFSLLLRVTFAGFGSFSAVALITLAFDRYLHKKYLDFYNAHMTKKKSLFLISTIFSLSISVAIMTAFGSLQKAYRNVATFSTKMYFLTITIIIFLYTKVILAFRNSVDGTQIPSRHRAHTKLFRGVFAIESSLVVSYLPIISFSAYASSISKDGKTPYNIGPKLFLVYLWLFELMLLESSFNSVILVLCNNKLKIYFR